MFVAGEPLPDPQSTGWTLGTFESLALSNNPAIQQATASASKAVGFRNQVGRKPNPVVGYIGTLPDTPEPRDWQLVSSEILASSPEMQSARSCLTRALANITRQEAQATPYLSFMLAAGRDNGTGSGMVNAQVGMPIPVHNANQGNISAAHAEYCRASQDVRRTELAIQSRLAQAQNEYESASAAVEQYRAQILPRAVETLKLVEDAYAAGEFDFLQVLVARRTYFDSNLAYLTA